jgi:hypothetical protein
MNSSIQLRKYEQDYQDSKKFLLRPQKSPEMAFKLFDIRFTDTAASPKDHFTISLKMPGKRMLLAKDSLFELRKRELRFKMSGEVVLRVEGKNDWGVVRVSGEENLIDIRRHGEKVGHVVLEHTCK